MTNDNDTTFRELADAVQEIDRLKAENFELRGELGSIRSGSAKVVSFKESEIKALKAENARLESALKGLYGKGLKELLEPTICILKVMDEYAAGSRMYGPSRGEIKQELARLRGLVPEAPKK